MFNDNTYIDEFAKVYDTNRGSKDTYNIFGSGHNSRMEIVLNSHKTALAGYNLKPRG